MRNAPIIFVIGLAGVFISLAMIFPVIFALFEEEYSLARTFFISMIIALFMSGALMLTGFNSRNQTLRPHDLLLSGLGIWLFVPFLAAIPLTASIQVSTFGDALFETMSAFTTTGASVVLYPELDPMSITAWRHIICWLGGFWTLLFCVTILVPMKIGALALSGSPLLQHDETESVYERLAWPAINIFKIYIAVSLAIVLIHVLMGLDLFTSIMLTMSAISTTGFAPFSNTILMALDAQHIMILSLTSILGATAFPLWLSFRARDSKIFHDVEFRIFILSIFFFAGAMVVFQDSTIWETLVNATSLLTTTAFLVLKPGDSSQWPILWSILPIAIGGMALSTSGGIKIFRCVAMTKFLEIELSKLAHPSSVRAAHIGSRKLNDDDRQAIWTYFIAFLFILVVGLIGFAMNGVSFETAWTFTFGFMNNGGAVFRHFGMDGIVATFTGPEKGLSILLMLFGRLELIIGLVLFSRIFWRFAK